MQFLIADTFTDSLGRLTGDEQKAVKQTAFDLQVNPANPGMQFHRLSNSKDKDFWSARVTDDIRLVVHKTAGSLLLCYVDHHDKAYRWAERRKLETHPKTGAVQFVEVRERIEEIRVPKYVDEPVEEPPVIEVKESRTPLFGQFTDDELLGYGVPPDWVSATREVNDDTALLSLIEHLPQEASEALLELATGGKPEIRTQLPARFRTRTRVAAFKLLRTLTSFDGPSTFRGTSGQYFCIQTSGSLSSEITQGRRKCQGPPVQGRPLSRFTAPCFWLGKTRRAEYYSRRLRTRWRTRFTDGSRD